MGEINNFPIFPFYRSHKSGLAEAFGYYHEARGGNATLARCFWGGGIAGGSFCAGKCESETATNKLKTVREILK